MFKYKVVLEKVKCMLQWQQVAYREKSRYTLAGSEITNFTLAEGEILVSDKNSFKRQVGYQLYMYVQMYDRCM